MVPSLLIYGRYVYAGGEFGWWILVLVLLVLPLWSFSVAPVCLGLLGWVWRYGRRSWCGAWCRLALHILTLLPLASYLWVLEEAWPNKVGWEVPALIAGTVAGAMLAVPVRDLITELGSFDEGGHSYFG